MDTVAKDTGNSLMENAEKFAVKGVKRMTEKMEGGKTIQGGLRTTIIPTGKPSEKAILASLKKQGYKIVNKKNRYENPSDGYRDLSIKVQKGDGVVSEILVVGENMLELKMAEGGTHMIYEVKRIFEKPFKRMDIDINDQQKMLGDWMNGF